MVLDRSGTRTVGRKAQTTRNNCLRALDRALCTMAWRKITVWHITRLAGCSPSAFYQYWASVEDAFHELCDLHTSEGEPFTQHMTAIAALLELEKDLDWDDGDDL